MTTAFDTMAKSFADVAVINDQIDAFGFLEATESLVVILESLGSAFGPVKSDILGNVKTVRTQLNASPECKTLQALIQKEINAKQNIAKEALLWLKRALEFTSKGLNLEPNQEVSTSFTKAYKETLSQYHSFLIRPIFSVAMKAVPSRSDFFKSLGGSEQDERLMTQFNTWRMAMEKIVLVLVAFYNKI